MSDHDQASHEAEVRERWGDTEAYRESRRRTKEYSEAAWARIKAEGHALDAEMAGLMKTGVQVDGEAAMAVAERMRAHIDRWFYPLSHAAHVGLADMYTADPRFRAHYDDRAEGLAEYVATAIRANAERAS